MKVKNAMKVIIPWLILFAYFIFYLLTEKEIDVLYLFVGVYILFLGSFVYLKLPNNSSSTNFLILTSAMANMFLFLYSHVYWLNLVGIFFLSICPLLLYLFLYSFIESENKKLFRRSSLILSVCSLLCYFSFMLKIFPGIGLFVLLFVSISVSYKTIYEERKLFLNSLNFKLLSMSILIAFTPFIISYSIPILFSSAAAGIPDTVLLIILFPACIAYILVYTKAVYLSDKTFFNVSIIFLSTCFFSLTNLLNISMGNKIIVTFFFSLLCYIYRYFNYLFRTFEEKKIKKNIKELSNEKIEILGQVTYASILNNLASLLLNSIKSETQSATILVLMKSENDTFVLCQSGKVLVKFAKKIVRNNFFSKQTVNIKGEDFYLVTALDNEEGLFLFFKKNKLSIDLDTLENILVQYVKIFTSLKQIYTSRQNYIVSTIDTNDLVQMKLFNNLEKEKNKYTHYLHDNVLQSIIGLHTLVSDLHGDTEIESLVKIEFSRLIRSIRDEIFNISPSTLYYLSFEENIRILIEDFNQKYTKIKFVSIHNLESKLPKYLFAPVYRIIKEINENIGKHSKAAFGITKMYSNQESFSLVIEDDGIGISDYFHLEKKLIQSKDHIGLLSIKNDLKWLNGSFEIVSKPTIDMGTIIKITIPIENREEI